MALGEAVVGEGVQLPPDLLADLVVDAVGPHAREEPLLELRQPLVAAFRPDRLAEPVGLGGGEVRHVDGDLHELLLEERHAEGLGERLAQQRMRVGDRLGTVAAPDVRVDRAALDRAGPDEGHLHDQVVEAAGLQPGQRGHLGTRLHLEHADRVGRAEHLVDLGLLGQRGEIDLDALVQADEVDGVTEQRQHPEPEQVELHQPHRGAVVLVPLQDAAALLARPLHGAHLDDGPVTDHHPAGVDPEVAGEVLDLGGQFEHR